MLAQFGRVCLEHPVLKVTCSELEENVREVYDIGEVVESEPDEHGASLDFLERISVDYHLEQRGHG